MSSGAVVLKVHVNGAHPVLLWRELQKNSAADQLFSLAIIPFPVLPLFH